MNNKIPETVDNELGDDGEIDKFCYLLPHFVHDSICSTNSQIGLSAYIFRKRGEREGGERGGRGEEARGRVERKGEEQGGKYSYEYRIERRRNVREKEEDIPIRKEHHKGQSAVRI